jgi:hydrogenase maturation protease
MTARPTLVLGIGNVLMGDEGVGTHAVAALEADDWPPDVQLVDGGTGGFHLLSYLLDHDRIVMIDATMDGQPPGTVSILRPKYASDFPRSLTAHDIGLRDLVEAAALLGPLPAIDLVTVSIAEIRPMVTELSPAVNAALADVKRVVRDLMRREAAASHA